MKIGITLPVFQPDPLVALQFARSAEAAGIDGVFVFDHLWAIGQPERPALHGMTMLSAVAAVTERVAVGSLVARVGVVADAVLAHAFRTVHALAGERLIAGIGAGDRLSRAENEAYGMGFESAAVRLEHVRDLCRLLRTDEITTWVGGRSKAVREVAVAEADALNLWEPDHLQELSDALGEIEVTWAGQVRGEADDVAAVLREVDDAGASWAVCAPVGMADGVKTVSEAAVTLR